MVGRVIRSLIVAGGMTLATPSLAYDAVGDAKVGILEVTYMPQIIFFQVTTPIGACQAGQWIKWSPQGNTQFFKDQNSQAVLSALMTAKAAGQSVRIYLSSSGCSAEFIYIL